MFLATLPGEQFVAQRRAGDKLVAQRLVTVINLVAQRLVKATKQSLSDVAAINLSPSISRRAISPEFVAGVTGP